MNEFTQEQRHLRIGDEAHFSEHWIDIGGVEIDEHWEAVTRIPYLISLAKQSVDNLGNSYRDFNVGSAMLALDSKGGRLGVFFGGNFTPYKGADWNCAEKRNSERLEEAGFDKVLAVAVVGPVQADSTSGLATPTLHPCGRCRCMFAEGSAFSHDTLVITATPDESEYEVFMMYQLLDYHQNWRKPEFPDKYHSHLQGAWNNLTDKEAEARRRIDDEIVLAMGRRLSDMGISAA